MLIAIISFSVGLIAGFVLGVFRTLKSLKRRTVKNANDYLTKIWTRYQSSEDTQTSPPTDTKD